MFEDLEWIQDQYPSSKEKYQDTGIHQLNYRKWNRNDNEKLEQLEMYMDVEEYENPENQKILK